MTTEPLSFWEEVCWEGRRWRRATAVRNAKDAAPLWTASWNVGANFVGEPTWAEGATEDEAKAKLGLSLGFDPWSLAVLPPEHYRESGCP